MIAPKRKCFGFKLYIETNHITLPTCDFKMHEITGRWMRSYAAFVQASVRCVHGSYFQIPRLKNASFIVLCNISRRITIIKKKNWTECSLNSITTDGEYGEKKNIL